VSSGVAARLAVARRFVRTVRGDFAAVLRGGFARDATRFFTFVTVHPRL
jgi:hypothetical protein